MNFADIHIHALYGVDDGAHSAFEMYQMIRKAYDSGTRILCFTPHYYPKFFGETADQVKKSFEEAQKIAQRYPNLQIFLGNELRYTNDCESQIRLGGCRTINETGYVLVDFTQYEQADTIICGLKKLQNAGYRPILAHAERYEKLDVKRKQIRQLKSEGILIQVNAGSLLGEYGVENERRAKKILASHLADFISSDAHDQAIHTPELDECYRYVVKKYGEAYAKDLFWNNARNIILRENDKE